MASFMHAARLVVIDCIGLLLIALTDSTTQHVDVAAPLLPPLLALLPMGDGLMVPRLPRRFLQPAAPQGR